MVVKYNDKFSAVIERMADTIYIKFMNEDSFIDVEAVFKAEAGIGVACYPNAPEVVMTSENIGAHVADMLPVIFKGDESSLENDLTPKFKCCCRSLITNVIESTR